MTSLISMPPLPLVSNGGQAPMDRRYAATLTLRAQLADADRRIARG